MLWLFWVVISTLVGQEVCSVGISVGVTGGYHRVGGWISGYAVRLKNKPGYRVRVEQIPTPDARLQFPLERNTPAWRGYGG